MEFDGRGVGTEFGGVDAAEDADAGGEGVWMSLRVFYIIAPIALFSIFAWVIYISFWVYFHWIA